jgi:hypothetical protein
VTPEALAALIATQLAALAADGRIALAADDVPETVKVE